MAFHPDERIGVLLQDPRDPRYLGLKSRPDNGGIGIERHISLERHGQEVLSRHGGRIGGGQRVTHVSFLVVHHSADGGSAEPSHGGSDGCPDQGALRVTADDLTGNCAGDGAARRPVNSPFCVLVCGAAHPVTIVASNPQIKMAMHAFSS